MTPELAHLPVEGPVALVGVDGDARAGSSVEHEAEEYRGDPWNRTWTENGRFAKRVLPFLQRHLAQPD